jgi:hypothetical protein
LIKKQQLNHGWTQRGIAATKVGVFQRWWVVRKPVELWMSRAEFIYRKTGRMIDDKPSTIV